MEIVCFERKAFEEFAMKIERFIQRVEEIPHLNLKGVKGTGGWLDHQDVCLKLRISKRTLQHYRDTGVLPFAQIGHKCYYKREDVEQLLQTKTEKAETGKSRFCRP